MEESYTGKPWALQALSRLGTPAALFLPAAEQSGKENQAKTHPEQNKLRRTDAESGQNKRKEQPSAETHQQDTFDFMHVIKKLHMNTPCLPPAAALMKSREEGLQRELVLTLITHAPPGLDEVILPQSPQLLPKAHDVYA